MPRARATYDRQWVRSVLRRVLADMTVPSAAAGGRLAAVRIHELASSGESSAAIAERELMAQALVQLAGQELRGEGKIRVGWNGTLLGVPSRLAISERDEDGVRTNARQYPLWIERPWEDVVSMRDSIAANRNGLSVSLEVLNKVLSLRAMFPDAGTPLEACEMAGWDPREFWVDEEGARAS